MCPFIVLFCLLCPSGSRMQRSISDITCLMNLLPRHAQKLFYGFLIFLFFFIMMLRSLFLSKPHIWSTSVSYFSFIEKLRWVFWRIICVILLMRRCMLCTLFPMEGCGCSIRTWCNRNCSHYRYICPEQSWLASVYFHSFYLQISSQSSSEFLTSEKQGVG